MSLSGVCLSPSVYVPSQLLGNSKASEGDKAEKAGGNVKPEGNDIIPNSVMDQFFSGCGDLESYPVTVSSCSSPGGTVYNTFSLLKNSEGLYELYVKEFTDAGTGPKTTTEITVNLSTGQLTYTVDGVKNVLPNPNNSTSDQAALYKRELAYAMNIISSIQNGGIGCKTTAGLDLKMYTDFLSCAKDQPAYKMGTAKLPVWNSLGTETTKDDVKYRSQVDIKAYKAGENINIFATEKGVINGYNQVTHEVKCNSKEAKAYLKALGWQGQCTNGVEILYYTVK